MTKNEKAFREAEEELENEKIQELKTLMKLILQKIQEEKEKKSAAEEAMRILKLDMEDLRKGKIEKIRERHGKSQKVREISPISDEQLGNTFSNGIGVTWAYVDRRTTSSQENFFTDATAGTYIVTCANGTTKEFYIG